MTTRCWFFAVALCLVVPTAVLAEVQAAVHVAPKGSDDNSGTEAKPFATIDEARQAVRAVNQKMTGDIVVLLHGGTYPIGQTIVFETADSGSGGHNVVYKAADGETSIVSGGKPVTGWQKDDTAGPKPKENHQ